MLMTEKQVILFTFPPVPHVYSISPFGLKVESYLRVNQIPHKVVYTSKFGPKGKIPYIHLVTTTKIAESDENHGDTNSNIDQRVEVIPDSNVIITTLNKEFQNYITDEKKLKMADCTMTPEEAAISHAFTRMLDEHTSIIGFYYRYTMEMENFCNAVQINTYLFNADVSRKGAFIAKIFKMVLPNGTASRLKARGLLSHSKEELWDFSFEDLASIENFLKMKQEEISKNDPKHVSRFFLGKKWATSIDCAIFGHLSQFLYIDMPNPFPQQVYIKSECPHIMAFMKAFRDLYWRDWDQKCQRCENEKFKIPHDPAKFGLLRKLVPISIMASIALLLKKRQVIE